MKSLPRQFQIIGVILALAIIALTIVVFLALKEAHDANERSDRDRAERGHLVSETDRKLCEQGNKTNALIRVSVRQSLKTLPTLAYYQEHPEELQKAIESTKRTLRLFGPTDCTDLESSRL